MDNSQTPAHAICVCVLKRLGDAIILPTTLIDWNNSDDALMLNYPKLKLKHSVMIIDADHSLCVYFLPVKKEKYKQWHLFVHSKLS